MLLRPARSLEELVSLTMNSEAALAASSRMDLEIVLSSSNCSPLALRPAASRMAPSAPRRNT